MCVCVCVSCMRQGMLTLSGAPSTTSHFGHIICPFLDYYILTIFHNLGSPLSYHTLIFDLMSSRNIDLYSAYIYTYIILEINTIWTFDNESPTIFNKPCTYITFKSAVKHNWVTVSLVDRLST